MAPARSRSAVDEYTRELVFGLWRRRGARPQNLPISNETCDAFTERLDLVLEHTDFRVEEGTEFIIEVAAEFDGFLPLQELQGVLDRLRVRRMLRTQSNATPGYTYSDAPCPA